MGEQERGAQARGRPRQASLTFLREAGEESPALLPGFLCWSPQINVLMNTPAARPHGQPGRTESL